MTNIFSDASSNEEVDEDISSPSDTAAETFTDDYETLCRIKTEKFTG